MGLITGPRTLTSGAFPTEIRVQRWLFKNHTTETIYTLTSNDAAERAAETA